MTDTEQQPKRKRKSRIVRTSAYILAFLLLTAIAMNIAVLSAGIDRMYEPASAPQADVAVVFGASVYRDGRVSAALASRLSVALELYSSHRVKHILVSGDNSTEHYNETDAMKRWLVGKGVPQDAITCDYSGFRTLDTVARANAVFGFDNVLLVTNSYHLPRALFLADSFGLVASGVRCGNSNIGLLHRLREYAARVLAWLDVNLLRTPPTEDGTTN